MALGVFLPLISAPFVGTLSYFGNGFGDGVVLLLLMGVAVGLVVMRRARLLLIPGGLSAILLLMFLLRFNSIIADMRTGLDTEDLGVFQEFGETLASSFGIQWGFGVLVLGTVGVLVSAFMGWTESGG